MKNVPEFKILVSLFFMICTFALGQEKEPAAIDTLKLFLADSNDSAEIKMVVLSNNTFTLYMKIIDDGSIINSRGKWRENNKRHEYTFDKKDFILPALFDTTKYANDYSIQNDSTLIFDESLWSLNIWGIWCNDIIKTK